MKKLLKLIALIVIITPLQAQNENNQQLPKTKTVVESMDSLLMHVNKIPVTSHILYDRVLAFAGLQDFNQGERTDTSVCRSICYVTQTIPILYSLILILEC